MNTNDGRSFLEEKTEAKVGDTIKIELPSGKIAKDIGLKKGNLAFISGGTHVGSTAKITDISEGTITREKLVELELKKKKFKTTAKNVFVVGEKKPEIEIGEEKE